MPPRMQRHRTLSGGGSSTRSSLWGERRKDSGYSPMLGRIPASEQPIVSVDSDGASTIDVLTAGGRHTYRTETLGSQYDDNKTGGYQPTPEDEENDEGHADIVTSSVSLLKSILGIGLVSMPYICSQVGFVNFMIFLAVFSVPSHIGNLCLAKATELVLGPWHSQARIIEQADFLTLGVLSFGNRAKGVILFIFIMVCWGGTLGVFIALQDILDDYLSDIDGLGNHWVYVTLLAILVFPLCCLDTLHSLRHTSYLGIMGIAALAVTLTYWGIHSKHSFSDLAESKMGSEGVSLFPVFIFSYMGQYNFIRIYVELKKRSLSRVNTVSCISLFGSFVLYGATGVMGYLAFLEGTQQDVFINFSDDLRHKGFQTHLAKVLFGLSMLFTAPVYLFESRNMIEDLMEEFCPNFLSSGLKVVRDTDVQGDDDEDEEGEFDDEDQVSWRKLPRRVFVVAILLSATVVVSVGYPHVTSVLGLLGATTSTATMWILPPAFLLRVSSRTNRPLPRLERIGVTAFLVCGFICIPAFTGLVLWKLIDPADAPPPMEPL